MRAVNETSRDCAPTLSRLLQSTFDVKGLTTVSESSRNFLFLQLSDLAPAISKLLKTYPSRLRAHVSTGDVINTYGISIVYQVFVDVLTDRCKGCGETQFTAPNFGDCPNHRFATDWAEVASGEGEGTEAALERADVRATEWLEKRGVRL